jgi:hypothetical protein
VLPLWSICILEEWDAMQVSVGFDYVLVLEWLSDGDEPTGARLHSFLPSIGFNSKLVICHSWENVQRALTDAASAIGEMGVPVIHLETHGSDPWIGAAENIGFGPGADSGTAWTQVGALLAPLNVAAGFRLLFVSAACWGSGVIAAIGSGEHSAPFACAVGFRTEVREGRLRDSMRELYRSLKSGLTLEESVASAQRELVEGQEVRLEVAVELAVKILRTAYYDPKALRKAIAGPHRRRRRARGIWNSWFPPYLQAQNPVYRFENAKIGD